MPLRIVITSGPSYAPLDQVRRLSNFSTGELGTLLAEGFGEAGHNVICFRGVASTRVRFTSTRIAPGPGTDGAASGCDGPVFCGGSCCGAEGCDSESGADCGCGATGPAPACASAAWGNAKTNAQPSEVSASSAFRIECFVVSIGRRFWEASKRTKRSARTISQT